MNVDHEYSIKITREPDFTFTIVCEGGLQDGNKRRPVKVDGVLAVKLQAFLNVLTEEIVFRAIDDFDVEEEGGK
jgi:hypothetical protein